MNVCLGKEKTLKSYCVDNVFYQGNVVALRYAAGRSRCRSKKKTKKKLQVAGQVAYLTFGKNIRVRNNWAQVVVSGIIFKIFIRPSPFETPRREKTCYKLNMLLF